MKNDSLTPDQNITERDVYGIAYRVVVDENHRPSCPHCKHDTFYTIADADGVYIGTSWGDEETVQDICDLLNMAFNAGRESK